MLGCKLKSWKVVTPEFAESICRKYSFPEHTITDLDTGQGSVKQVPAMLRRRFNVLGRCAVAAAFPQLCPDQSIPSVFVSRHADAALSFRLQQDLGRGDSISPTDFSLAVHNALSGLVSIARKDTSPTTSIASATGLVIPALLEAVMLLDEYDSVLCVIYDEPVPDIFTEYAEIVPFPFALAMVLHRSEGAPLLLRQNVEARMDTEIPEYEILQLLRWLTGQHNRFESNLNGGNWTLS